MSILVVEDNVVSAKIIHISLQQMGYPDLIAGNAEEALRHLKDRGDIELLITDIVMPGMDGLEFVGRVRSNRAWDGIPVIIVSSMNDPETIKEAARLGCRHFVAKPVSAVQLRGKISQALTQDGPVLQQRNMVVTRLGIDYRAYDEILATVGTLLTEKVTELEGVIESGKVSHQSRALTELAEAAQVIGAERVIRAVNRVSAVVEQRCEDESIVSAYRGLVRELDKLRLALKTARQWT